MRLIPISYVLRKQLRYRRGTRIWLLRLGFWNINIHKVALQGALINEERDIEEEVPPEAEPGMMTPQSSTPSTCKTIPPPRRMKSRNNKKTRWVLIKDLIRMQLSQVLERLQIKKIWLPLNSEQWFVRPRTANNIEHACSANKILIVRPFTVFDENVRPV